ncbi:MAG: RnfABCDGE type electron transport complex subunit D [Bacteroidaceae bacterium]|nr:RnfABCDGE type electron transport complex subunit D [Bacteroidaceae bacterium]
MNKLVVSPSPHAHSGLSTAQCMYGVLIALIPAFLVSIYFFGINALLVTATSVAACVLFEYLIQKYLLKGALTITDGTAVLTGVLLAFNLPSNIPLWIVIVGALFAIGIGKMSFGGLGNNIFNPALAGRIFLLISFPQQMTTWPQPSPWGAGVDGITGPTTLNILKQGNVEEIANIDVINALIGNYGGSFGEVSAIALIIGFIYLIWRNIITWHIPVSIILTVFLFSMAVSINHGLEYALIFSELQIFSGGLLLGAIFMATDYVTSPMTPGGMILYGVLIGIITVVIRLWGAYPEGLSFAIFIMNGATPLINKYMKPKRFGEVVKHG